mgnify:CR=1 FL=1
MFFKKKSKQDEETSYWLSFSDLMASVLIIFILLFVYNLVVYDESMNEREKMIQELTSTRMKIIAMLQEEFDKEDIDIIIDPKTGAGVVLKAPPIVPIAVRHAPAKTTFSAISSSPFYDFFVWMRC